MKANKCTNICLALKDS
jgi:hypothetical protein